MPHKGNVNATQFNFKSKHETFNHNTSYRLHDTLVISIKIENGKSDSQSAKLNTYFTTLLAVLEGFWFNKINDHSKMIINLKIFLIEIEIHISYHLNLWGKKNN